MKKIFLTVFLLLGYLSFGQNISIKGKDFTLEKIIKEIEQQTNLKFAYGNSIDTRTVVKKEFNISGTPLDEVLLELEKSTNYSFEIIDSNIVIRQKKDNSSGQLNQTKVVSGKVMDNLGVPLAGATVIEKGTQNITITDMDGFYSLQDIHEESVLVFSFIGFITKTIEVTEPIVNVVLQEDTSELDEVVVVGYGSQKKISVVGAQSTVNVEEIQQPVGDITSVLAGRVAGLTGVQRSGLPGYDGSDIWIRGISTFSPGGSTPLILVDGVERSMNNIDPRDIASFTILKDASATAVYGIRGANGVILIETRKGKISKPKVTAEYTEGFTFFTKVPDLIDGVTYMKLANEALTTRGEATKYSQETIDRTATNYDPFLYPNVNWFDEVFKSHGKNRKVSVNATGGTENTQYYVSVGYYDETGILKTDVNESYDSDARFKRYNVTSNLTLKLSETTKANIGVQGYMSEGTYPAVWVGEVFKQAMIVSPVEYPVMYPGGFVPGRSAGGELRNPYADVARSGFRTETRNQLYSNLRITQDLKFLTKGLSITGMFAFDAYNQHQIIRQKRESTYITDVENPYNEDGTLNLNQTYEGTNFLGYSRSNGGNRRFYLEASLNYNRAFGKHELSGLLLFNRNDYVDAFAGDFKSSIPYRNQGLAMRATYAYDQRYFLELNGGYNGSENFSPSNRYGFFPSMAVGWVVSNEKFFEDISNTISYLKLRYSDGKVGAASGAGRFAYLSTVDSGQNGYNFGVNPVFTSGIAETYNGVDVSWAESRKQDIGLEVNFLNNSLSLIVDAFKERAEGAFLTRGDVPHYLGLANIPYGNLGIIENKGIDGSLNYKATIDQLFLSFRGTFSYSKNKIIDDAQAPRLYDYLNSEGNTTNSRWGYIAERLFTLEDDINGDGYITTEDGFPEQTFGQVMPGDIKYSDLNGDGKVDNYDLTVIGKGDIPFFTFGFGTTAQYKGFDVSLFFQGQTDADIMLSGEGILPFSGEGGRGNLYTIAADRWTPENNDPYATYPRLSYGGSGIGQGNNTRGSTWWERDMSFLRLKTAEVGYSLSTKLVEKMKIDNLRLYFRGTNLLTFSKFKLWDPELKTSNGSDYPNISVFSLGLNVQF